MPLDGTGQWVPVGSSVNPAVTQTAINSTDYNALLTDLKSALSTAVFKDGQATLTGNLPMAGFKLTGLGAGTAAGNSVRYEQIPPNFSSRCDFRLTLTTGVATTTADVTAATTLYATPYKGNGISLYDGAAWIPLSSAEFSIAVPATTSQMYDVFCYSSGGVPTLELTAWTNDTTRATALVLQNGVYVKTGVTTRRYLGSFRTTTVSGQTEDSNAKRYVWNYYNRVDRVMRAALETTDNWSYTLGAYRQTNANAANQLDYVQGVSEEPVMARAVGAAGNGSPGVFVTTGIGVDSTTTNSAQILGYTQTQAVNQPITARAEYFGFPGVGRHTLPWLEFSQASGTTTWYGDSGSGTVIQTGISGTIKS